MTCKEKILKILEDGKEHNSIELCNRVSWKWSTRISELKKDGYPIEVTPFGKYRNYKMEV